MKTTITKTTKMALMVVLATQMGFFPAVGASVKPEGEPTSIQATNRQPQLFEEGLKLLEGKAADRETGKAMIAEAAREYAPAQYFMGLVYRKTDQSKAFDWFKKAARQGHEPAKAALEQLMRTDDPANVMGGFSAQVQFRMTYEQMILENHRMAKREVATPETETRRSTGNAETLKERKEPAFTTTMTITTPEGEIVIHTPSAQMRAYAMARIEGASQGVVDDQVTVGDMLLSGQLVRQDRAMAAKWYKAAQDAGSIRGVTHMAALHESRQGGEADYKAAFRNYLEAAEHGDAVSMVRCAELIMKGKVDVPLIEAERWLERATDKGVGHEQRREFYQRFGVNASVNDLDT